MYLVYIDFGKANRTQNLATGQLPKKDNNDASIQHY